MSMDDTQRERRLFEYGGQEIAVMRPTESQMFALAVLHNNRSGTEAHMKVIRRMFKIIESLVSDEDYEAIEDGMIEGTATPMDFANLMADVFKEDWDAAPGDEPDEEPEPKPLPPPVKAARRAAPPA